VTTSPETGWTASRGKQLQVSAIAAVGYPAIHVLARTWRWRAQGLDHLDAVRSAGRYAIMAFWHGRILPSIYFFRHRDIVVITSDNFDGEWVAKIIHRFGYTTVRGSTSRNAARVALKAKRRMEEGHAVGITVDGPRGPALVAQPGAVWLAKVTGNPIVPFHIEASSFWTARSWDAAQIPRPFSRIGIVLGQPFFVPAEASDTELDGYRRELEERLTSLQPRARALARESSWP
jgi:lysophospholipid acyltransferase (LPLAT)-like uncharacterized protein